MLNTFCSNNPDHGITLMTRLLSMSDVVARAASKSEYGAHISYPTLKQCYEEHLTEARRLNDPQTREMGGGNGV